MAKMCDCLRRLKAQNATAVLSLKAENRTGLNSRISTSPQSPTSGASGGGSIPYMRGAKNRPPRPACTPCARQPWLGPGGLISVEISAQLGDLLGVLDRTLPAHQDNTCTMHNGKRSSRSRNNKCYYTSAWCCVEPFENRLEKQLLGKKVDYFSGN